MLDYGYRSACCNAPIRLGTKKNTKTKIKINIWVCVKCGSRDVEIVKKGGNRLPEVEEVIFDE
jgi:ribosomal protein L37AE/L43A